MRWTHYFKGLVGTPVSDPDVLADHAKVDRFNHCLTSSMEVSAIRIGDDLKA